MNASEVMKKDQMDATLKRNLQKLKDKKKAIVKQHAAPGQQLNPNLIKSLQLDMFLKETPTIEHEQSGGAPQISSAQVNAKKMCDHVEHEEISYDEFGNSKEVKTELNILEWKQACRSCKDMNSVITSSTRPRGAQSSDIRKSQLKMTGKLATINPTLKPTVNENQLKLMITTLQKDNSNLKIELDNYVKRNNQTDPETEQVLRISHRLFLQLLSMFEEPQHVSGPSQPIDTIKRSKKLIGDSGITAKLAKVLQKLSLQYTPQESKSSQTDKDDQEHQECRSLQTLLEQQITELQLEGLQNLKQITGLSDQLTRAKSGEQRINFMTSEIQKLNMIILQKDAQLKDVLQERVQIPTKTQCSTADQQVEVNIYIPCENCEKAALRLDSLLPQLEQQIDYLKNENILLTQHKTDYEVQLSQLKTEYEADKIRLNSELMQADREHKKLEQNFQESKKEYEQQLIELQVNHEVKLIEMATDKQIQSQSENELNQMIKELNIQIQRLNQNLEQKDQLITWIQFTLNNFSYHNIDRQIQELNQMLENDQHELKQSLIQHLKQELIAKKQQNQGNALYLLRMAVLKKLSEQLILKLDEQSQQKKVLEESRLRTKQTVEDIKKYLKGHQNEKGFDKCNALLLTVDCQLQQDLIQQINITLQQQQKQISDLQQLKNFQLNELENQIKSLTTELEATKSQYELTQQESTLTVQQKDIMTEQLQKDYQNILLQIEQLKLDQEKKNQELTQIQIENMKLKAQQIQTTNLIKNQYEDTIKLLKQQFETDLVQKQEILQDEIDQLKSVILQFERSQIMNQELLDEENQFKDQEITELKLKIIRLEEEIKKLEKEKTLWLEQKLDLLNTNLIDEKSVFQDSYLNSSLNTSTLHQLATPASIQIDKDLLQILNLQAHVIESDLIK